MIGFVLEYFFDFWWLFLPFFLSLIVWEKWYENQKIKYSKEKEIWTYLEIKIPKTVKKSLQSMEEIFTALHSVFSKKSDYQRYFKGYRPPFFVFILFTQKNNLRFYIRTLNNLKNFVKTRVYAQYPDAEINEVEDPLNIFPPKLPNPLMNCFVAEFETIKKEPYPIKTYRSWERASLAEERIDPISFLSEGTTQLKDDEWIIFQIFAMPVPGDDEDFGEKWVEKGKKEVNKLIGKKEAEEPGPLKIIGEFILDLLKAPFVTITPKEKKEEKKESEFSMMKLTPGEMEIVKALQEKLTKVGYKVGIRAAYISFEPGFKDKMGLSSGLIFSFLKLFDFHNLNGFKPSKKTSPEERIFEITVPKESEREFYLKRMMYSDFKSYGVPEKSFILNSEELASIFHIPTEVVPPTTLEKIGYTPKPAPPTIPFPESF